MNVPAKVQDHDPETGEIRTGLPVGYDHENQSLAVSLARAEVDQQIATARALPRHPSRVMQSILSLATLDDKSAEECVYALPRGGKPIKGPSIRLAEIISSQWGNCRVGARVVHVDRIEKYVEAEGVFHDLETNTATTARVRRRIVDSKGRLFNDDMIVVTGNAAASIAKRNAILGGVPKAVWRKAYDAVEAVVAGDAKTLVERREKAMKAFAAFGVTPERVCESLGVGDVDEITLEHMPTLMGAHAALKNNEATVEELFPVQKGEGDGPKPKSLNDRLNALAGDEDQKKDKPADQKKAAKESDQDSPPASDDGSGNGAGSVEKPSSGSAASPSKSDDGTPSPQEARAAGAEARDKGMSRKAMPAEFRKDPALSEAWLEGFDTGQAEADEED
ncbi:MAG: hypothetical protein K5872_22030 [Rhizobiaceae bacterium]|nr:hypothetical protein [Rhizobiaceae bacterium]MCV0408899.1 hypothetical protein [Rhizobiaceae bacterium]